MISSLSEGFVNPPSLVLGAKALPMPSTARVRVSMYYGKENNEQDYRKY
jgi:hypothetical protein